MNLIRMNLPRFAVSSIFSLQNRFKNLSGLAKRVVSLQNTKESCKSTSYYGNSFFLRKLIQPTLLIVTIMKKIYRLLGLMANHRFALPVQRERFVTLLQPHVADDVGSGMDIFSLSNAEYKGFVGPHEFYLRKKRGFAKRQGYYWKAFGKFLEENGQLTVEVEMRNFPPPVYFYFIVMSFFALGTLGGILMTVARLDGAALGTAFSNLLLVALLTAILGLIIRTTSLQTIEKMRIELQSNFHQYAMEK